MKAMTIKQGLEQMCARVVEAKREWDEIPGAEDGDNYYAGEYAARLSDLKLMVEMVKGIRKRICKNATLPMDCIGCNPRFYAPGCPNDMPTDEWLDALTKKAEGEK